MRWSAERQSAALFLLAGSPTLQKLNLSGLGLTDAVAPALAAILCQPSALQVLSAERNDLRESGLLLLIEALAGNTTLRELRLTGQKQPIPTTVEDSLASMMESGGASGLIKLGIALRGDKARRVCDQAIFKHVDRQRLERQGSLQGGSGFNGGASSSSI